LPWVPAYVMLFDRHKLPDLQADHQIPGKKGTTDVDLCLQIRKRGYVVGRHMGVYVYHPHKGDDAQRRADLTATKAEEEEWFPQQVAYMKQKWGDAYMLALSEYFRRCQPNQKRGEIETQWLPKWANQSP
ncbi:MAG TPA: hypothetical protein VEC14_03810, partial [Reyranellaceae bacterium]|nr:hypothetical protein [Reyranellaceae bacterium]